MTLAAEGSEPTGGGRRTMEPAFLVTGSAAFYAAPMIPMKHRGAVPPIAMVLTIALAVRDARSRR